MESQPPDVNPMAQHHPRKRQRTQSRASTASVHSIATQPNPEQNLAVHHGSFQTQWNPSDHVAIHPSRDMVPTPAAHPMASTEDMILRPASQMQVAQPFAMDSSMQSAVGPPIPTYHQHPTMHHGLPSGPSPGPAAGPTAGPDAFGNSATFTDQDSQLMDRDDVDERESVVGPPAGQKPASNRTSANNEVEMRQLFQFNRHRQLEEVAKELHGNERGPNSERARQVFAMLWLNQVCDKGKGSVPRGRVYANYASRCATERITVLNPASFGKLVRVLFPGLKTRRLGVRGESKYHYVNFTLMDDQPELAETAIQPALPFPDTNSFNQTFSTTNSQAGAVSMENAALPSPHLRQTSEQSVVQQSSLKRTFSLYNQPNINDIDQLHSTTSKTALYLSFQPDDEAANPAELIQLPRIESFLPPGTDPDAAKSLAALYRSHCTSLVECIRYCKEKTFFHLYTSFQGTLTMPVQKLFANPSIAPWIEESDFILYQRMMMIVSGLILQVVPKAVLDTLRNISERLVSHIRESFQGQPRHVVQAKEAPATIFAGLLDRALRVNLTAHAAANMLSNPLNRDQMYLDWITMVRIRKVAECVPTRGMDDVANLLLDELRNLLEPANVPWEIECRTLYGDLAQRKGLLPLEGGTPDAGINNNMLEKWADFLRSLPVRFPYATPAELVWSVQRVGTEVMRDITIAQGKSFGSWWVTKCWVDEMISFLAEQIGFMKTRISSPLIAETVSKPSALNQDSGSMDDSRLSTGSEGLNISQMSQPQPDRAPFPSQLEANTQDSVQTCANHDDSGIGIRTPEEDFPIDKFEFQQDNDQEMQPLSLNDPVS
ncbi:RFX DNA-binding domain-containing protein [Xylariomycetidae sp. FL2044]|nr:RFX DNA-binding domain-containing protein [Xylariomycetidae sp. FL2044]